MLRSLFPPNLRSPSRRDPPVTPRLLSLAGHALRARRDHHGDPQSAARTISLETEELVAQRAEKEAGAHLAGVVEFPRPGERNYPPKDMDCRRRRRRRLTGEMFHTALDTFRSQKERFTLTALGMMIGTTSLILVVTVGLTGKQYVLGQVQSLGATGGFTATRTPPSARPCVSADCPSS